jgi:hypothetical protein
MIGGALGLLLFARGRPTPPPAASGGLETAAGLL